MPHVIDKFDGEFCWLSNFWPAVVALDGIEYPTVEHAYQAAKYDPGHTTQITDGFKTGWVFTRKLILEAKTPGIAKRWGREPNIRKGWPIAKLEVMEDLLQQKFRPRSMLGDKLKATSGRPLIEGNHWGDTYWGVCEGKGANNLGELLMKIRDELP